MKRIVLALFAAVLLLFVSGCHDREKKEPEEKPGDGIPVVRYLWHDDEEKTEEAKAVNGKAPARERPEKTGYCFDGWYDGDRLWDFENDTVTGDLVLEAHYTPLAFMVYYDAGGGVCAVDRLVHHYGEFLTLPEVTREGYRFCGWIDKEDYHIQDNDCETTRTTDLYLLAHWSPLPLGATVVFGHFEQDNDTGNGMEPIEWYVLQERSGQYQLLSKHCLVGMRYDESRLYKPYRDCTLRAWLNGEFLRTAFTAEEAACLHETYLEDVACTDTVFLVNRKEGDLVTYCAKQWTSQGTITEYAAANGIAAELNPNNGITKAWWWIRSDNKEEYCIRLGEFRASSWNHDCSYLYGVRPAVWVDKAAVTVKE